MHQIKKKKVTFPLRLNAQAECKPRPVLFKSEYPFHVPHLQMASEPEDDQGIKRSSEQKTKAR